MCGGVYMNCGCVVETPIIIIIILCMYTSHTCFFSRGAFSVVKRAIHKKSKQEFAAKIINTRRLTARGELYTDRSRSTCTSNLEDKANTTCPKRSIFHTLLGEIL